MERERILNLFRDDSSSPFLRPLLRKSSPPTGLGHAAPPKMVC